MGSGNCTAALEYSTTNHTAVAFADSKFTAKPVQIWRESLSKIIIAFSKSIGHAVQTSNASEYKAKTLIIPTYWLKSVRRENNYSEHLQCSDLQCSHLHLAPLSQCLQCLQLEEASAAKTADGDKANNILNTEAITTLVFFILRLLKCLVYFFSRNHQQQFIQ